jgi:hypothetical protein
MTQFDALVLSLPARHSTLRMRVWRTLKETGCGVLRDGVYVLPSGSAGSAVLSKMEAEISSAGGSAMTVELKPKTAGQLAQMRKLFDRTAEYGALVQQIGAATTSMPRIGSRKAGTTVHRLQRSFDRLSQMDFFPGQAKLQAAHAIAALKRTLQETYG